MIPQIDFTASNSIRAALSDIGRTEDVRFSPDGRLLTIAGYGLSHCLILRISVDATAAGPHVIASDFMEITSESIGEVHGLDFIDDRTLAIANRDGLVSIIQLPPGELAGRRCQVKAIREIWGGIFCRLKSPGSIAVKHETAGVVSLLVCNNYTHQVTRHVLAPRANFRVRKNNVLLKRSLNIPDGIAVSNDGQWIAVSSHGTGDVKMFQASAGPDTEPAGTLRNANYPHGLRFTSDDRFVVVADAGAPVLRVYERGSGWSGPHDPVRSVVVLDDETFERGRVNPEEGGPKGLDIDKSCSVVAITCEEQSLAFFSLASITDDREQPAQERSGQLSA